MAYFTIDGTEYDEMVSDFQRAPIAIGSQNISRTIDGTARTFFIGSKQVFEFRIDDMSATEWGTLQTSYNDQRGSSITFDVNGSAFTCKFDPPQQEPQHTAIPDHINNCYRYSAQFRLIEV